MPGQQAAQPRLPGLRGLVHGLVLGGLPEQGAELHAADQGPVGLVGRAQGLLLLALLLGLVGGSLQH